MKNLLVEKRFCQEFALTSISHWVEEKIREEAIPLDQYPSSQGEK